MQIRYDIPDALHRQLKAVAALEGITLKDLIIRLLEQGLDQREIKR